MKQTVLICDRCPRVSNTLAVTTLALHDARSKNGASVDLCDKHYRELRRAFAELTGERVRYGAATGQRAALWRSREQALLAYLKTVEMANHLEVAKALKLPHHAAGITMRRLAKQGRVTPINVGPHRRWKLVAKPEKEANNT